MSQPSLFLAVCAQGATYYATVWIVIRGDFNDLPGDAPARFQWGLFAMRIFRGSRAAAWMGALWFPALLLLIAAYYRNGMGPFSSPIVLPDEFGYMSVAAFLTGHNWVAVARDTPWYSFGYSLLLAPLFAVTDPAHWYRVAQSLNIALIVVLGICANLFLRKIDRTTRPSQRHLVVAVILLYPSLVFYARMAWAETLVAIMPWLLGLLLYRIVEVQRRYIDAFFFGCLLVAVYYIHARLIVLLVAGVLALLFVAVKAGRWREFGIALCGMILVAVPAHWFKKLLLAQLYGGAVIGAQQSPLKMLESMWHRMGDQVAWQDMAGSAAGQSIYLVIATLGLVVVGGSELGRLSWRSYRDREWADFAALALVALGAVGCYLLVLVTMGSSPDHPNHVFYGRYTEPLVLPIMAMGLLYMCRQPRSALSWMTVAFLGACILVPVGMHIAERLPDQTTFFSQCTGLFTYRTPEWKLATNKILRGFLVVEVLILLAFRVHRYIGLAFVAALLVCANHGLAHALAHAASAQLPQWQAWPLNDRDHTRPRYIRLDLREDNDWVLSTRIQAINAASTVILSDRWPAHFHGTYENMVWDGKKVGRSACIDDVADKSICQPLKAPAPATVHMEILAGDSLTVHHALLPYQLHQYLTSLPYIRAVWTDLELHSIALRYDIVASKSQDVLIKVFVTKPNEREWLVERQVLRHVQPGKDVGTMRIPVPVRDYSGHSLARGYYTLVAVVATPEGNDYATKVSIPMRIK